MSEITLEEFPRDADGNPSHHRCYDCGYVWQHGRHGGHDCKAMMKASHSAEVQRLTAELATAKEEAESVRKERNARQATVDILRTENVNLRAGHKPFADDVHRSELDELRKYKSLEGTHDRLKLIAKYCCKAVGMDHMEVAPADPVEAITSIRQRAEKAEAELQSERDAYSGRLATAGDNARSAMVLVEEAPEGWRKRNILERLAVIEDECLESEELVAGLKSKLTAAEAERDTLRKVLEEVRNEVVVSHDTTVRAFNQLIAESLKATAGSALSGLEKSIVSQMATAKKLDNALAKIDAAGKPSKETNQ